MPIYVASTDWPYLNDTTAKFRKAYVFVCHNKNCYWRTGHDSMEHARDIELTHRCAINVTKAPREHLPPMGWDAEMATALETMWSFLDDQTDYIMRYVGVEGANQSELDKTRGRAQGLAKALFLLVGANGYADETAIAAQAHKRWRMRQGQIPFEPTPGMAGHTMAEVRTGRVPDYTSPELTGIKKATNLPPKPKHEFTEEQIKGIKDSATKGFDAEILATIYKTTVAKIEQVIG